MVTFSVIAPTCKGMFSVMSPPAWTVKFAWENFEKPLCSTVRVYLPGST
ncbi:MAG: hypothetical protein JWN34_3945 [Bryobacterales bacterium]|nr:hypothetical protein [Bryobacterales bacterium]